MRVALCEGPKPLDDHVRVGGVVVDVTEAPVLIDEIMGR